MFEPPALEMTEEGVRVVEDTEDTIRAEVHQQVCSHLGFFLVLAPFGAQGMSKFVFHLIQVFLELSIFICLSLSCSLSPILALSQLSLGSFSAVPLSYVGIRA